MLVEGRKAPLFATRDQHQRTGAQPFVPKITSKIRVLTWQRPLKNRFLLYLKCDCRPGLAGRVLLVTAAVGGDVCTAARCGCWRLLCGAGATA